MKLYRILQGNSDVLGGLVTKDNAFFLCVAGIMWDQPHHGWIDLKPGQSTVVFDKRKDHYTVVCESDD